MSIFSVCPKTHRIVISTERRNLVILQTLNNRSLMEPVPSIPEGFEMTVWIVFGQTLFKWITRYFFICHLSYF
jgi:hypothetical protein